MCGIAGVVSPDPGARSVGRVRKMLDLLRHRGPDEEGIATAEGATIGARRLAIIDLVAGQQPMANEDRSILAVQNGEIYNFRELRSELVARGHVLRTQNDTEILPHLYEEHGATFVERLRGMFALAIWDGRLQRLILARDRVGKKPLVYARWRDGLAFASEIQALLDLEDLDRSTDPAAIAEYLTYGYVPAPRTAFMSIRKVEPACVLVVDGQRTEQWRYWTPRYEPKRQWTIGEASDRVRDAMDEAVQLRLMSDVPLGVLLSGGIDSSAVVAFASRRSARPVKTFSIGFGEAGFDELRYARIVAEAFHTEHHEFVVEPSAASTLPLLVRHFGEPFADSSAIPTYQVARLAREHVTVALNGDGGDELFGGYPRYRAVALAASLDRVPLLARVLNGIGDQVPAGLVAGQRAARVRRLLGSLAAEPAERYLRWMGYFSGVRQRMLSDGVSSDRTDPTWFAGLADNASARDPVDRAIAADVLAYLPGDLLVKMDIATMACSLEARSPLLDHQLIDLVAGLPSSYKVNARQSKIVMRQALRGILPDEIIDRGKLGFGVPVGTWMRGPLREMLADHILAPTALIRGLVRPDEIDRLYTEHTRAIADHTPLLWSLFMLELWHREVVQGTDVAAAV